MPVVASAVDPGIVQPGPKGYERAKFLSATFNAGRGVLFEIAASAVKRLIENKRPSYNGVLYTPEERGRFVQALGAPMVLADLMGRATILRQAGHPIAIRARSTFAVGDWFARNIHEAYSFFKNLMPALGIQPERYGPQMERDAFTMCVASEQTLLKRVQGIITRYLGTDWNAAPYGPAADAPLIRQTLIEANVTPLHPQYCDMVFRTNVLDSLNNGAQRQVMGMEDEFPVWQYLGIHDGREGDDHRPMFNKYYPTSATFAEVRGPRVYNCRCCPRWIHKSEWARLQAAGAVLQTTWGSPTLAA